MSNNMSSVKPSVSNQSMINNNASLLAPSAISNVQSSQLPPAMNIITINNKSYIIKSFPNSNQLLVRLHNGFNGEIFFEYGPIYNLVAAFLRLPIIKNVPEFINPSMIPNMCRDQITLRPGCKCNNWHLPLIEVSALQVSSNLGPPQPMLNVQQKNLVQPKNTNTTLPVAPTTGNAFLALVNSKNISRSQEVSTVSTNVSAKVAVVAHATPQPQAALVQDNNVEIGDSRLRQSVLLTGATTVVNYDYASATGGDTGDHISSKEISNGRITLTVKSTTNKQLWEIEITTADNKVRMINVCIPMLTKYIKPYDHTKPDNNVSCRCTCNQTNCEWGKLPKKKCNKQLCGRKCITCVFRHIVSKIVPANVNGGISANVNEAVPANSPKVVSANVDGGVPANGAKAVSANTVASVRRNVFPNIDRVLFGQDDTPERLQTLMHRGLAFIIARYETIVKCVNAETSDAYKEFLTGLLRWITTTSKVSGSSILTVPCKLDSGFNVSYLNVKTMPRNVWNLVCCVFKMFAQSLKYTPADLTTFFTQREIQLIFAGSNKIDLQRGNNTHDGKVYFFPTTGNELCGTHSTTPNNPSFYKLRKAISEKYCLMADGMRISVDCVPPSWLKNPGISSGICKIGNCKHKGCAYKQLVNSKVVKREEESVITVKEYPIKRLGGFTTAHLRDPQFRLKFEKEVNVTEIHFDPNQIEKYRLTFTPAVGPLVRTEEECLSMPKANIMQQAWWQHHYQQVLVEWPVYDEGVEAPPSCLTKALDTLGPVIVPASASDLVPTLVPALAPASASARASGAAATGAATTGAATTGAAPASAPASALVPASALAIVPASAPGKVANPEPTAVWDFMATCNEWTDNKNRETSGLVYFDMGEGHETNDFTLVVGKAIRPRSSTKTPDTPAIDTSCCTITLSTDTVCSKPTLEEHTERRRERGGERGERGERGEEPYRIKKNKCSEISDFYNGY